MQQGDVLSPLYSSPAGPLLTAVSPAVDTQDCHVRAVWLVTAPHSSEGGVVVVES